MATQSDLAGFDEDDEIYRQLHDSDAAQLYFANCREDIVSPSALPRAQEQTIRQPSHECRPDDQRQNGGRIQESDQKSVTGTADVDLALKNFPDSDGLHANMLAQLKVFNKPLAQGVEPSGAWPDEQLLYSDEVVAGNKPYETDSRVVQEATIVGGVERSNPDGAEPTQDKTMYDFQVTQAYVNANLASVEQGTLWQGEQLQQTEAHVPRRKKRRLRRKRPAEPVAIQSAPEGRNMPILLQPRVAYETNHQCIDATHGTGEPTGHDGLDDSQSFRLQQPFHDTGQDPSHVQLQDGMQVAVLDEEGYYHRDHGSRNGCIETEIIDQRNQQETPMMNYRPLEQPQIRDGSAGIAQNYAVDPHAEQCPSSDILGNAAQEFEDIIYRKQQAKSAKHQAERNAWQSNLQEELQAKQELQDRLNVLQREKDDLAAAIEKQRAKVAGFETMASKLKTFIGGLANDMGALKRDISSHRQNCKDLGEETKENKALLSGLLQQLSGNAEKASQLKNEAIKACHNARSDLSLAKLRADQQEGQLKEQVLRLAEEKSLREQIQNQLSSTANSGDAMLHKLKSIEKSVLDKLSEMAIAVAAADSGAAISTQLGSALLAVQGLKSEQTATVNSIVSVKGIVEQFSETLNKCTDFLQRPNDEESSLKAYISQALNSLKSDLCHREKLAVQNAVDKETISTLQKKIEDGNTRLTDCESSLSTARASMSQLEEHNVTLRAKIATLQSRVLHSEQDSAQLSQLKAELSLKVQALQTTTSELNSKTIDLHDFNVANGELQSQLDALNLRLETAPSAEVWEIERQRIEDQHRSEIENAQSEATAIVTKVKALELSEAANALKRMTADYNKATEKLTAIEKESASSKQQLDELHRKYASDTSSMQKRIHSAETSAAGWKKELDSWTSNLQTIQQATEATESLKAHLSAEREAVRKNVEEKDSLREQLRQLRTECEEDDERSAEQLQQCQVDSKGLEQRLRTELQAAEERCTEVAEEVQASAQNAITAEKAKHDKQIEALHQSIQDLQFDLQTRIQSDEEFRESLQKSWQVEEKRVHAEHAQLNSKILEAEKQRDKTVADNERIREELANAHRAIMMAAANTPKLPARRREEAVSSDPRLHNRPRQPEDVGDSVVNESQQASHNAVNTSQSSRRSAHQSQDSLHGSVSGVPHRHPASDASGPHNSNAEQSSERSSSKQAARGPIIEESQQHPHPVSSQLQTGSSRHSDANSERNNEDSFLDGDFQAIPTVMIQDTSLVRDHVTRPESQYAFRGPSVEERQQYTLAPSQKQNRDQRMSPSHRQSSIFTQAENETQFVPETQFEPDRQTGMPSFANFNAASTLRNDTENGVVSGASNRPSDYVSASRHFQKSMPPPNTATKMVRNDTDSSSLSSLSQELFSSPHPAAIQKNFSSAATRYKTPEAGPKGGKAHSTQSILSDSSPGFVEQMANARNQTTYHAGGSGNKAGTTHNSNRQQSRAPAPKRKAQSQDVQGYDQQRKRVSVNRNNQGNEPSRSSQDDGYALSQLVSSQNRASQGPSSSRGPPRASTQPSRMQTLAGTSARNSVRQTRNTTRKLSKNDEMSARFARELNAAR